MHHILEPVEIQPKSLFLAASVTLVVTALGPPTQLPPTCGCVGHLNLSCSQELQMCPPPTRARVSSAIGHQDGEGFGAQGRGYSGAADGGLADIMSCSGPSTKAMPMSDVTKILLAIEGGDQNAADELLPLVYQELRRLAAVKLSKEKPGQSVQPTMLVYEEYLRLVDVDRPQQWSGRGHFFGAAAEAMRRILVERARQKRSQKHGGELKRIDLDVAVIQDDALGKERVFDGGQRAVARIDGFSQRRSHVAAKGRDAEGSIRTAHRRGGENQHGNSSRWCQKTSRHDSALLNRPRSLDTRREWLASCSCMTVGNRSEYSSSNASLTALAAVVRDRSDRDRSVCSLKTHLSVAVILPERRHERHSADMMERQT